MQLGYATGTCKAVRDRWSAAPQQAHAPPERRTNDRNVRGHKGATPCLNSVQYVQEMGAAVAAAHAHTANAAPLAKIAGKRRFVCCGVSAHSKQSASA